MKDVLDVDGLMSVWAAISQNDVHLRAETDWGWIWSLIWMRKCATLTATFNEIRKYYWTGIIPTKESEDMQELKIYFNWQD